MEHFKGTLFGAALFIQIAFIPFQCFGQLFPFYDNELNLAEIWQGDKDHFYINKNQQLQLAWQESGKSYLSTPASAINDAVWEIYIALDFNPSSSNYARIYLVSDNPDLTGPLNGYFVMLGGGQDEISLYKQEGNKTTKIIDGLDKRLDINSVEAKIKVSRSSHGEWELWSAVGDTTLYTFEGTAKDQAVISSFYAGLLCTYTATRADKFYFDAFTISGDPFSDIFPPVLLDIEPLSYTTLRLIFSEPLAIPSIAPLSNFQITPTIGPARNATVEKNNEHIVHLSFQQSFEMGSIYTLFIENITDTVDNKILRSGKEFQFYLEGKAKFRDVVINEIMANPTPKIGLPEVEYIELFNKGETAFNLSNWHISDDKSQGVLKDYLLLPEEHLILCAIADTAVFKKFGHSLGVAPWPTLNNDGDIISLTSAENILIDQVSYNKNWYKSTIRGKGGYALEMIDPLNPCSQEDNWMASMHSDGGTPGHVNSVFARKPDTIGPELLQVFPKSADTLLLYFNENLDTTALINATFMINKKPIKANVSLETSATASSIRLILENPLQAGQTYVIEVSKIKDCNGNYISTKKNTATFGLIQNANPGDVLINEVLFNPRPNGVDFVEIYNNSSKYLNLKDWMLANISFEKEAGQEIIDNRKPLATEAILFGPGNFLVLTSSMDNTLENYPHGENILEMNSLPSYPDKEGTVIVLNNRNVQIDRFDYSDQFHSPILDKKDGVSLERIAYDGPTQDPHNWTSAASTHSFATPGLYNSQSRQIGKAEGKINVSPKVIAPDTYGVESYTTIQYTFSNQNYVANIYVFDAEGRVIKKIAEQATLGQQGFFTWEGVDDAHKKVKVGVYMIFIELFDLNGTVKIYKEPIVIGRKL